MTGNDEPFKDTMRIDPASPKQMLLVRAAITLAAIAGTIGVAVSLSAQRDHESVLRDDGMTVQVAVTEITERGRGKDPLEARVRLHDGRETLVDVADTTSRKRLQPGSTLTVRVARHDIAINKPADIPDLDIGEWIAELVIPAGAGLGGIIIATVIHRGAIRRADPSAA